MRKELGSFADFPLNLMQPTMPHMSVKGAEKSEAFSTFDVIIYFS